MMVVVAGSVLEATMRVSMSDGGDKLESHRCHQCREKIQRVELTQCTDVFWFVSLLFIVNQRGRDSALYAVYISEGGCSSLCSDALRSVHKLVC